MDPLLRRAFSVAALDTEHQSFDVIYRVQGKGTSTLSATVPGEVLDLLGPLGKPFHVVSGTLWLVGGGVGVPPLAMLAQQQNRLGNLNRDSKAFVGGRGRDDLLCIQDFETYGIPVSTATEDGSYGSQGYVTQILEAQLEAQLHEDQRKSAIKPVVCACGPIAMLRAVAHICAYYDVACQVSLEESMPCGVGVCNGCVVRASNAHDDYGQYKRICVDGPVMPANDIAW